jgi:dienelactone hydrolase
LVLRAADAPAAVQVALSEDANPPSLAGLWWKPRRDLSPAVILLPMMGRGKEDWTGLARRLHREGIAVLAMDLSEQGRGSREQLTQDVRAAFHYLRAQKKVDAARIGLVGASMGANAALMFAAREPLVRAVALLSPGLNYRGLSTEPALRDYGVRALFLAAAEDDFPSAQAVRRLAAAAQGEVVSKLYPGTAHGTDLLDAPLGLDVELVSFLRSTL